MYILRGSAHILAFICTSNLTEESASPSVHGLSAIHVLTKISVKLPFQRAIAPQEHHHYTLDHKTLRICFAAHPLYRTSIVTMPSPLIAAHEAIPSIASRFHPFCSRDLDTDHARRIPTHPCPAEQPSNLVVCRRHQLTRFAVITHLFDRD